MSALLHCTQINLHHCIEASAILAKDLAGGQTNLALIQEPYINKNRVHGMDARNCDYFYSGNRPRTCVVVNKQWNAAMIPQFCGNDLMAVKLSVNLGEVTRDIVVASAYFPFYSPTPAPEKVVEDLVNHCNLSKTPLVMSCDANAHNVLWGSTDTNVRGTQVAEFISAHNLFILNRGNKPTFVTRTRKEVLDITLCTLDLFNSVVNWEVSEENSLSDHRYIKFSLTCLIPQPRFFRNPRKAVWEKFTSSMARNFNPDVTDLTVNSHLDEAAEYLNSSLVRAYNSSCPLQKQRTTTRCKWWNTQLRKDRAKLRSLSRAERNLETEESRTSRINFQREYKRRIRSSKRDMWRKFCTDVEGVIPSARIHKILSKDPLNGPGNLKNTTGGFTQNDKETLRLLM